MFQKFIYSLGLEEFVYDKKDLDNHYILSVKNSLKPVKTLKKRFYVPQKNELLTEIQIRINRKRPKIDKNELEQCRKKIVSNN